MIKVVFVQGGYAPAFFCDVCGGHIDRIGNGMFLWEVDANGQPVGTVVIAHKRCGLLCQSEMSAMGKTIFSDEMVRLPKLLVMNMVPFHMYQEVSTAWDDYVRYVEEERSKPQI